MKSEKAPNNRREEGKIWKERLKLRIRNHQILVLPVAREARLHRFPFISHCWLSSLITSLNSRSISVTAQCTPTPVSKLCPYPAGHQQRQSSSKILIPGSTWKDIKFPRQTERILGHYKIKKSVNSEPRD